MNNAHFEKARHKGRNQCSFYLVMLYELDVIHANLRLWKATGSTQPINFSFVCAPLISYMQLRGTFYRN